MIIPALFVILMIPIDASNIFKNKEVKIFLTIVWNVKKDSSLLSIIIKAPAKAKANKKNTMIIEIV